MKTGAIYHHLGMGDTIICNAIINQYSTKFEKLFIFCKPHFYESVTFLYRTNPKVVIIPADDSQSKTIFQSIQTEYKLLLGFDELEKTQVKYNLNFDEAFYKIAGLSFDNRFDQFKLERDNQREEKMFNILNVKKGEYIFLHEDNTRLFRIKREHIKNKQLPILWPNPTLTGNIFDYCSIIENAAEVHVIDSSFKNLCETLDIKTNDLFYHCYFRNRNMTKSRKNWKILK